MAHSLLASFQREKGDEMRSLHHRVANLDSHLFNLSLEYDAIEMLCLVNQYSDCSLGDFSNQPIIKRI
jgi:hypothetical protein